MKAQNIPNAEYRARRDKVLGALKGSVGLVLSGEGAPPLMGFWQPASHFEYLTGIKDEPGAAVLFDAEHEDPKKRCVLFLRPLNPEMEAWDGYRDTISQALKDKTGFETVLRSNNVPRMLTAAARQRKKLACLHGFGVYDAPVSPDLTIFKRVSERVPGVSIEDRTDLLNSLRAIKSKAELSLMEAAIHATAAGYDAVTKMLAPGVGEKDVQRTLERAFVEAGAGSVSGPAYNSIVGSGRNATVLHYMANTARTKADELMVIDAGASFEGYAADITRTYPVGGKFTNEQRELYEVVLDAQQAAIEAVKPGRYMWQVEAAARKVIESAGHGDKFIHGIGHQLGLEVHDATPDGPLKAGMVITIEPGVYFADKNIGIRIEDDILVTSFGHRNLSEMIPKKAKDVEKALARKRWESQGKNE
jgi:Xaa-Pro aminopeptidase